MQYEGKQHNWAMQTRHDEAQADTERFYAQPISLVTSMEVKSFRMFIQETWPIQKGLKLTSTYVNSSWKKNPKQNSTYIL